MFSATLSIVTKTQKQPKYPSFCELMNKMCSLCIGVLFSNRNEQNTNTCHDADEPLKHYTKWRYPSKLHDCTDKKWLEKTNLLSQKSDQWLSREGWGTGIDWKYAQGKIEGDKNILKLIAMKTAWIY